MSVTHQGMRFDSFSGHSAMGVIPSGQKDFIVGEVLRALGGGRMDSRGGFNARFDAAERAHVDRALRFFSYLLNPQRTHLDAAEVGFTQRALTYISPEMHPTLVPPLEARKWIPTVVEGNPGDASYLWRKPTRTGIARFFAPGGARDLPVVGAFIGEINIPYFTVGAQIQYDYFELLAIGAALANGQPFDFVKEKLIAALEANEKKLDLIAAFGSATPPSSYGIETDADVGMTGLLNNASISNYAIPVGASGSKLWVNKTADEVLADLSGIVAYQRSSTYKVHAPNTMLMPIAEKQSLISRRMSDVSGESILGYFQRTQREAGQPIDVFDWQYMTGSGTASSDQMVVFNRDPRMLKHVLSTDKATLPASTSGLITTQIVYSRTAGTCIWYPLSITSSSYIG